MAIRTTSIIPTGGWAVDAAHSSVQFAVKHMGIATVRGKFTEFEGTLKIGETLAGSNVRGTVTVASITTGEEQRDAHLPHGSERRCRFGRGARSSPAAAATVADAETAPLPRHAVALDRKPATPTSARTEVAGVAGAAPAG